MFFLVAYSIEAVLKICGLGFLFNKSCNNIKIVLFNKNIFFFFIEAYLRDPWNILDFVIVVTGYIPLFVSKGSGISLQGLRSLRVLRPLRTISSIKSLKILLTALFSAFPMLMETLLVFLFRYINYF